MDLKRAVNRALNRSLGYELRKVPEETPRKPVKVRPGDRLVESPVFVLCTLRSGSTLLRVLLNSHSRVHAPPEMHLGDLVTGTKSKYAERSLRALGLDGDALRYLLWDRMLHRELAASGKDVLVYKNPRDVFIVDDLVRCWPRARFVFLLRHPLSVARSRHALRPHDSEKVNLEQVLKYGNALEEARHSLEGLTVRYEELTAEPEATLRGVCSFIGVDWEPQMLDYGQFEHGGYRYGLGDRKGKIKSGRIQEPERLPSPDEIPAALRPLAESWGYLSPRAATTELAGST